MDIDWSWSNGSHRSWRGRPASDTMGIDIFELGLGFGHRFAEQTGGFRDVWLTQDRIVITVDLHDLTVAAHVWLPLPAEVPLGAVRDQNQGAPRVRSGCRVPSAQEVALSVKAQVLLTS